MEFRAVAESFEHISQYTSRIEITKTLASLLSQTSAREAEIISYLSLGELRPPYIGTQFNLAEKSIAPVIEQLLDIPADELMRYAHKTGDLGLVVAQRGAWHPHRNPSIEEVYNELVDLEQAAGAGSQEKRADFLLKILRSVDPLSACYIIRIIIGKLRLGFSDMTFVDALSWMLVGDKSLHTEIEQAYNICADLGLITRTLKTKGIKGLSSVSLQVGIPIRPAAAERLPNAQAIITKLGPCIAEPKLDGFRLQVHIDNRSVTPKIWFFSRNLRDMSGMFPDLVKAFERFNVDTFIGDGEAIAYDEKTKKFVPFQQTVKRKRKYGIEMMVSELPIRLFLFDALYINGRSLLDAPYVERHAVLEKLFPHEHRFTVSVIDAQPVSTAQQLEKYFLENLKEGLEGVVVKKPDAPYQAGKRNANWVKLKRHEGVIEDTVDVVVLGYYYGRGKRASLGIGAFLVGVYDPKHDQFPTVAKVGTGLTDAEWIELKERCDQYKVSEQPHNVVCSKALIPNVWVQPRIVCEVIADEITKSPLHTAGKTATSPGFALRFPRFVGYRPDKSPDQATTVEEIEKMYKDQFAGSTT